MSDTRSPEPPLEPEIERRRLPSLVWLVPLLAVAAALALLWRDLAGRGPLIVIEFPTASGLVAGQTEVRFRDLAVGRVESLRFSDDLARVLAEVRMEASVAPYIDQGARFWVVRPQVSAEGISGLETVISGTYVEGAWDAEAGEPRERFTALAEPPPTPAGTPGLRVRLSAPDGGSLAVGSPVFFKRVEVGRVESKRLTPDGSAVEFDVFVEAPHDRRLTRASRFWNVSGIELELGADGARLNVASLTSLVRGGAAFDTFDAGEGEPVSRGHLYRLYASARAARTDVIEADLTGWVRLGVAFPGSVRGLEAGAAVEYRGLRVGRVVDIGAEIDPGSGRFATVTEIAVAPERLGLPGDGTEDGAGEGETRARLLDFLEEAVAEGLRARLEMGNLLTGTLYVALVEGEAAADAALDRSAEPPRLPALPSDIDEVQGSVAGVLDRLQALPVEALFANVVTLMENANALLGAPETRALPGETRALLAATRQLVDEGAVQDAASEATAALKALRAILEAEGVQRAPEELAATLASARALLTSLETADTAGRLSATLASAQAVLDDPSLRTATEEAAATLAALRAVLAAPGAADLPETTVAALRTTTGLLEQLRTENLGGATVAALSEVENASAALARSADRLPALLERLAALTERADTLLASVAVGSELNYETVTTLREFRDAARAINDLATLIERRPNAFILGK